MEAQPRYAAEVVLRTQQSQQGRNGDACNLPARFGIDLQARAARCLR